MISDLSGSELRQRLEHKGVARGTAERLVRQRDHLRYAILLSQILECPDPRTCPHPEWCGTRGCQRNQ